MALPTDKQARKERPIASGVLDYFPDAVAAIANVSFVGNQQHNPGEPMHWAREKSTDHADCVVRHLIDRGQIDDDGLPHSAKAAWRILALLQLEEESRKTAKGDTAINGQTPDEWMEDTARMIAIGCPPEIAGQIARGTTYTHHNPSNSYTPRVYLSGPMRGKPNFNFPEFDKIRDFYLMLGYDVISPADIDRAEGGADQEQSVYVLRDFWALYFLATAFSDKSRNALVLLPGWAKSVGAAGEVFLARWLGLPFQLSNAAQISADYALHHFAIANAKVTVE